LAALIDAAPVEVNKSSELVGAVRECFEAEGAEPRTLAAVVLGSLSPSTDDVGSLIPVLAAAAADKEFPVDAGTVAMLVQRLAAWAKGEPAAFSDLSDTAADDIDAALAELADIAEAGSTELAAEGLGAVAHASAKTLEKSTVSLIAALGQHRSLNDAVGGGIRDALLVVLETASVEVAAQAADGLTTGLTADRLPTDDAVQFALANLPRLAQSDKGCEQLLRLVDIWRQAVAAATPDPHFYRTPISAIAEAARLDAVPGAIHNSLLARLVEMRQQGGVHATVAAFGLAAVPWPADLRQQAAQQLEGQWPSLQPGEKDEVVRGVAGWKPAADELTPGLAGQLAERLANADDGPNLASTAGPLWDALPAEFHPAVAANLITHADPVRRAVTNFDGKELVDTLRLAEGASFEAVLTEASREEPEVRGAAGVSYLQRSFDDADIRWEDRNVTLVVERLLPGDAIGDIVRWLVERLADGHTAFVRAGTVLGLVFAKHGASHRAPVEQDLVNAVRRILPEADPEAGAVLGLATRGLADRMFDDVCKEMRDTREQRPKETVDAFRAARKAS
ncbi:MAG TPA: hypothetical protein VFA96_10095, partial [Nocardioides sp.]|nr:hypothetical protein [Nocardioides sp.]